MHTHLWVKFWKPALVLEIAILFLALYSFFFNENRTWIRLSCIVTAIILPIITLAMLRTRINDPYGNFHLALNIAPGAEPNAYPETEWLNMGYWKDTQMFPQACEALALRLIDAAACIPGGRVLDVGHACGDSLLLLLSHPDVPRPASLTGITSLPSHHIRSQDRISRQQSNNQQSCEVVLFCGDAIFHPKDFGHPLDPSCAAPRFSTILALDCAYHFASRELFLRQSFSRLSPGGRIALADLVVSDLPTLPLRMVLSRILSVRSENMITPQMYEAQLNTIGYVHIHITDISSDVFSGFRTFLKSRGGLWRLFELIVGLWVNAGGKFVIVSASKL